MLVFAVVLVGQAVNQEQSTTASMPEPRIVDPGSNGAAPADAIVLFDGKTDLSAVGRQRRQRGEVGSEGRSGNCQ
ncbi:MAG: hypothetical protein WKF84_22395 [Pyrinomonadaceae bacterium]